MGGTHLGLPGKVSGPLPPQDPALADGSWPGRKAWFHGPCRCLAVSAGAAAQRLARLQRAACPLCPAVRQRGAAGGAPGPVRM